MGLAQLLRPGPMRRDPPAPEETRGGTEEGARADGGHATAPWGGLADPVHQVLVGGGRVGTPTTGQHQRVDAPGARSHFWEGVGDQLESALGPHRPAAPGDHVDAIADPVPRRVRRAARTGEDLVRAGDVERLDAVEGDDHDTAFPHGVTLTVRRHGVNDVIPTDSAIAITAPCRTLRSSTGT